MEELFINNMRKRDQFLRLIAANSIEFIIAAFMFIIFRLYIFSVVLITIEVTISIILFMKFKRANIGFKTDVLDACFKEKNASLRFFHKGKIDKSYIYSSKFLTKIKGTRYQSFNLLEGCIDNHNFKSSNLHIYYVDSGGTNVTRFPVFKGRFYVIDLNYNIHNHVVIRKEGKFLKPKPKGLELVEFSKTYSVYSSCKLKISKKINSSYIEKIIALEKEHNSKLFMAIKDNKLYFGISSNIDYFEIEQYASYEDVNNAVLNEISFIKKILNIIN